MDQVKFVEESRPYRFKFFKGCLPQIFLGPFLNTLSHIFYKEISFKKLTRKLCNLFTVYPANIYLFKLNLETLEKGKKYVQRQQ